MEEMAVEVLVLLLYVAGCFSGMTYTNDWGVGIEAGNAVADTIAAKYGFINMGQVGS